jgi:hypothetical protein
MDPLGSHSQLPEGLAARSGPANLSPWVIYFFLLSAFPLSVIKAPGPNNDALLAYALALAIIYLGDPQVQGWRQTNNGGLKFLAAFMAGIRYIVSFLTIGGLVLLYAIRIAIQSGQFDHLDVTTMDMAFNTGGFIAAVPAFAASYFVVYTQPSPVPSGMR